MSKTLTRRNCYHSSLPRPILRQYDTECRLPARPGYDDPNCCDDGELVCALRGPAGLTTNQCRGRLLTPPRISSGRIQCCGVSFTALCMLLRHHYASMTTTRPVMNNGLRELRIPTARCVSHSRRVFRRCRRLLWSATIGIRLRFRAVDVPAFLFLSFPDAA